MTATVAQIWRHPIKGIGAEPLEAVRLTQGCPLPLDRAWAVLQEGGDACDGWRSCVNFLRGAKGPSLMAVTARVGQAGDHTRLALSHPDRPDLSVTPGDTADAARLIDWLIPIYPDNRPPPVALVAAPPEGMSDAPFPSVSILGLSSLRALSQKVGQRLDPRRFRGNLWIEGLGPWQEREWVGRHVTIGAAEVEVVEPITRCRATEANPDTGRRDADTLGALEEGWGHTDFGVYARVVVSGEVATGDGARLT